MKTAALLLALLVPAPEARARGAGGDPFNFLFLDAGARPAALGGAYTALAGDADALLYNPAGLGAVKGHEALFMHDQHFQGITQEYAAYASPWGWGGSLNLLRFGDTRKTTYSNPAGTGLADVGLTDLAATAGYGRELRPGLRAGVGLKVIREAIAGVAAQGYAADLGAQFDPEAVSGLTLAAAVQNLGPAVRFQSAREDLPINMRFGAAYRFPLFGQASAAALDVTKERSESGLVAFGLETVAAGVLPVRLGFTSRNQAGPGVAFGLGFARPNFSADYAFVPYGDLGTAHRFSLTVRWGNEEIRAERHEVLLREERRGGENPNGRFAAAERAAARGDLKGARRELEAARGLLAPDDRRIVLYYQKSAEAALAAGDRDEARELFIEAVREARRIGTTGPAVAGSYLGLSRCLTDEGNLEAARQALERALEADPGDRQREEIRAALDALHGAPQPGPRQRRRR